MNLGRLLVVDDEAPLRSTLVAHLREIGHEVLAVESATAALNRVKEFGPDIVLTDVQMPGMDGFELLAHLQKVTPGTDVVIFTGHGDVEGAIEAAAADAGTTRATRASLAFSCSSTPRNPCRADSSCSDGGISRSGSPTTPTAKGMDRGPADTTHEPTGGAGWSNHVIGVKPVASIFTRARLEASSRATIRPS